MHPLDRKLLRDLWRLRGQVLAIALIVATGVAVLSSSLAVIEALTETANAYYARHRFGDVFASVKRAPRRLVSRIESIPGVRVVEPRIVELATLDMADFEEPVIASLVSIPDGREPLLNRLALRAGRAPQAGQVREVLVNEAFAEAHGLGPGSQFRALINGRKRLLHVTGVALSPEYVYAIGPGALVPDARRYGIVWMNEEALAAAYDLDGAFNDVVVALSRAARTPLVIEALDALLDRYGGTGAYARKDQISNWFLTNEIVQLESIAMMFPTIFLAVAAFLTNMLLARLVAIERAEIGLIKAFGYGNATVAWHYAKLVAAMTGLGIVIGSALGYWLGLWTTTMYAELFRFPTLYYAPGPHVFVIAAAVSLTVAMLGALGAARRAAKLPPAEAMRPPAPPVFRRAGGWFRPLAEWVDQLTRIVVRQLVRWPVRALVTSAGVAAAVAVLVMAIQWDDALDAIADTYFFDQQRQDVTVGLVEAEDAAVAREFTRLPGVLAVEAQRSVPARIRRGHRSRRQALIGMPARGGLEALKDASGAPVHLPPDGVVLSRKLAEVLGVTPGQTITAEVFEGARPTLELPVAAIFETEIGTPAYLRIEALNRLLGDPPLANRLLLRIDSRKAGLLFRELKALPGIGAITLRRAAIESFYDTIGSNILVFIGLYVVFACTLVIGVVYNNMRIALSERGRDLATLRVLGFRSNEVAYVLLAESALLVVLAIPIGCTLGWSMATLMAKSFDTELFRLPVSIEPSTYGWSLVVTVVATAVCAAVVRRRVERLDLIAVLKTRE